MPVFAIDILKIGTIGQGWLLSISGIGSLVTTVWLSTSQNVNNKSILVIGGGMIGSLIAEELSYDYNVSVVDNNKERLNHIKNRNRKIQCLKLDIKKDDAITLIKSTDLAVNCLPGFMGFEILKKIIENKVSCVDIEF